MGVDGCEGGHLKMDLGFMICGLHGLRVQDYTVRSSE